jgi:hypothetical protein
MVPPKKLINPFPHEKRMPRNERKSWQQFEHLRTMARTGRYEEECLHKAKVGMNRPV